MWTTMPSTSSPFAIGSKFRRQTSYSMNCMKPRSSPNWTSPLTNIKLGWRTLQRQLSAHHGHYKFVVMSFKLINTPATLQAIMNSLFTDNLGKFMVIFFDNILIYNDSLLDHIHHLLTIFNLLQANCFSVWRKKCSFQVD